MITATVIHDSITISTASCLYDTMKGNDDDNVDVDVGFSPSPLPSLPVAVRLPSIAAIRDSNSLLSAWSWATVSSNVVTEVSIGSGSWVAFQAASYSLRHGGCHVCDLHTTQQFCRCLCSNFGDGTTTRKGTRIEIRMCITFIVSFST